MHVRGDKGDGVMCRHDARNDGIQMESDGIQMESDGIQLESDGIQMESDGIQMESDDARDDGIQMESKGALNAHQRRAACTRLARAFSIHAAWPRCGSLFSGCTEGRQGDAMAVADEM